MFDDGQALFDAVVEHGLEGIVAKRRSGIYRSGHGVVGQDQKPGLLTAEAVHAMLAIGTDGFIVGVGHGILARGEGARILTTIEAGDRQGDLVMFCRDRDLTLCAWLIGEVEAVSHAHLAPSVLPAEA